MAERDAATPLVSVVVPFFQSERHIGACIESLLAQRDVGGPFEVILIDNGARDRSAEIARGYDGITLLAESAPGAYAARNTGIRRAAAPIIALTDADCVADPDWLRAVLDGMRDPAVGALIGHCRYPREASPLLHLLGAYENAKARYVLERAPAHWFAYANNMAVRRALFDELGPFREWKRAGDSEFVHRMAAARPELRLEFRAAMRVTHLEFVRGLARARRLSLYTETNQQIGTFRELTVWQRLGVLGRMPWRR